ncbi:hypothetical protein LINGRAHAP2_LOCUS14713 [Linum grandiflorum]
MYHAATRNKNYSCQTKGAQISNASLVAWQHWKQNITCKKLGRMRIRVSHLRCEKTK